MYKVLLSERMRKNASVTLATRQLHKLKFQVYFSYFEIHLSKMEFFTKKKMRVYYDLKF